LRAITIPAVGGDTCFSSMYAAYDALSGPLREMLDGLTALHSSFKVLPLMYAGGWEHLDEMLQVDMRSVHPVVRVHPETGRKALFVDELWTEAIVELAPDESAHLLAFLFEHVKKPISPSAGVGSPTTSCCGTTGRCSTMPYRTMTRLG
jgi:alpha-ketoglutarate-dependent taurine dioxygenase